MLDILEKRKLGIHSGIPSFCSANKIVIEAIMDQAKRFDDVVLIEATSNQVNQYGGYMEMTSQDFKDYVYSIAEKLVSDCVLAGYTKIHLDTSMRLGDDDPTQPLSNEVIAERGAVLYRACRNAYQKLLEVNPKAVHPVFIIGSEVPIPGGAQEKEEELKVTGTRDFENTILSYRKKFEQLGLTDAWEHIIGIVVQPGVEFGDSSIHAYDRLDARKLCHALTKYPDIVFEGHSTDYQPPIKLKEMVEDGIAILKVGPALTYALREAIFALSYIEKFLITDEAQQSKFIDILEEVMLENPKDWKKHYHGTENEIKIARKFSFSDRSRYYFSLPRVKQAYKHLFSNLRSVEIPLQLLHQFMPLQYVKVRDGKLSADPRELAKDAVVQLIEDYNYAVKINYMPNQH
jgi:D-tagatose-1,6-bisphosphate aldolase subunit GatZ/KbaZ